MSLMPMLILGVFPFSVNTAAYQQLQRNTSYKWASQERLGHRTLKHFGIGGPGYHFIGPGEESISLNGSIYPQYSGMIGRLSLSVLRLQADAGIALPLISFGGLLLGRYIVEQIQETNTLFFEDGAPRKIDFTLSLKRYNEDLLLF